MIVFKLLKESLIFAFHELLVHKTRTILSLLGITIGIFSIISVFTIFDSMERNIREGIDSLGKNVLFITKWKWQMGGTYEWWKYYRRPQPDINDLKQIQKRSLATANSAIYTTTSRTAKYGSNSIEDVEVLGVSYEFDKVLPFDLERGRYFTPLESSSGRPVAIIGADIADNLFQNRDPIGRDIKIFGRKMVVIGQMRREGEDNFGPSVDKQIIIPMNFIRNVLDLHDREKIIVVKAKPNVSNAELKDELTGILRSVRKLKPSADNNFSINELDIVQRGFDELFGIIAVVGWIIGGFALLVGGFGIANIMFVSVRERINIIGIQKSLGAKNYFILLQFLYEAIFLAMLGGVLGLIIVFLLTFAGESVFDMELVLTRENILIGLIVSAVIGLLAGIIPAFTASRLNPVDAIRANA